jgi:hypothetical protein
LLAVVMVLWGCTLVLVAFLVHRAYGPLVVIPHSAQTVYWGEVKQIQFVFAPGPLTQIDTDQKTFLVWGSWLLDKGTRMERRESF